MHNEFKPKGLEIVGLTTEDPDLSTEQVRLWVGNYKVNYRISWATEEVVAALMQGRNALPQTFVISRDGRILKRFIGFSTEHTPGVMRQAIEKALNDEAGTLTHAP